MNQLTENLLLKQGLDRLVGRRLTRLRRAAGLTMEALAARSGLPMEELAEHERGMLPLPLSRVPILCAALNCRIHHLVGTARKGYERLKRSESDTDCRNS